MHKISNSRIRGVNTHCKNTRFANEDINFTLIDCAMWLSTTFNFKFMHDYKNDYIEKLRQYDYIQLVQFLIYNKYSVPWQRERERGKVGSKTP